MKKYQPSTGTEGADFFEEWCTRCARDLQMNGTKDGDDCGDDDWCPIIAKTFAYKPEDEKYPPEWTYDEKGQPCCTAFIPFGEEIPPDKCELTDDMFEQPQEDRD